MLQLDPPCSADKIRLKQTGFKYTKLNTGGINSYLALADKQKNN